MPNDPVTLDFLRGASRNSLLDFELSRLNRAANLLKQIRSMIEEVSEEKAAALLARLLLDNERLHPRKASRKCLASGKTQLG